MRVKPRSWWSGHRNVVSCSVSVFLYFFFYVSFSMSLFLCLCRSEYTLDHKRYAILILLIRVVFSSHHFYFVWLKAYSAKKCVVRGSNKWDKQEARWKKSNVCMINRFWLLFAQNGLVVLDVTTISSSFSSLARTLPHNKKTRTSYVNFRQNPHCQRHTAIY